MKILSLLSGLPWKFTTAVAAVITIALSIALTLSYMETRHLTGERNKLDLRINDPKTGYIATISQIRTNSAQIELGLTIQNRKLAKQSTDDTLRLANTTRLLVAAQAENRLSIIKLKAYLAIPPQGATLEAQITDVDSRFMESLK